MVQNCSFYLNTAENEGHDMYLKKVSKLRMANCLLASELASKSHSLWAADVVSLNVWNTSFTTGNPSNDHYLEKQQPLDPAYGNWNRSWKVTETPYASGK